MKKFIILLSIVLLAFSLSATDVSGDVSGNWTLADSPYHLIGDVNITSGNSLEIEAGVEIIADGNYEISVNGILTAIGGENDFILFHGLNNADWGGIRLDTDGNSEFLSTFRYCFISDTHDLNDSGIHSINTRVEIIDCVFDNHDRAISLSGLADVNPMQMRVEYTTITNCVKSGIQITELSNAIISHNDISLCGMGEDFYGAIQLSIQTDALSCSPTITDNWIHNNGKQGITIANLFGLDDIAPIVENNLIEENLTGIYLYGGQGEYRNNIIRNNFIENDANSGAGVMLYGSMANATFTGNEVSGNYCGFYLAASATVNLGNLENASTEDDGWNLIYDNVFFDGTPFNMNNVGSTDIMAQNNVWDSNDTAEIEARLVSNGTVTFQPFLSILAPVEIILDSENPLQFSFEAAYATHATFLGYNLYRNDELIAENYGDNSYEFVEMPELPLTFSVTAVYEEGESEADDYYIEATIANSPQNLIYEVLENSVELSWDAPEAGSTADLDHYNIHFLADIIETDQESGELFNLVEGTTYTVGVSAFYQNGAESEIVEIEFTFEHNSAEEELSLEKLNLSNYPNPFQISGKKRANQTTFSFNLPSDNFHIAKIKIYNAKGQMVNSLNLNEKAQTQQAIIWSGKDSSNKAISSGVYLYQLEVDGKKIAHKNLTIIK